MLGLNNIRQDFVRVVLLCTIILFLPASCSSFHDGIASYDDEDLIFSESNQFKNSIALYGGSVAHSATICHSFWKEKLCVTLDVYAASGAGFTIESNSIIEQVQKSIQNRKYDVYLFWCSTNDYSHKASIGSSEESYSHYDSQESGMNYCIDLVLESNPLAKIIVFTSLKAFDANGYSFDVSSNPYTLFQYVLGQISVCEQRNVPFFNQFVAFPVFNHDNYEEYYTDAIHPNSKGYDLIKEQQTLFIAKAY